MHTYFRAKLMDFGLRAIVLSVLHTIYQTHTRTQNDVIIRTRVRTCPVKTHLNRSGFTDVRDRHGLLLGRKTGYRSSSSRLSSEPKCLSLCTEDILKGDD